MENQPNDVQNSQTIYQWKAQETRNSSVPLPWSNSCCGGRKTRSNRRPTCFRRNFQRVRNLQKGTTGMSSEGPKMVGGRYGLARNGLKWPKSQEKPDDPRWLPSPLRRPDSGAFDGDWQGSFSDVIIRRSCFPLAGTCCRWLAGDASFGPKLHGSQMGQNDPTRCSRFWRVFPRVLELKMVFWGLGFHLAPKVMFI